MHVPGWHEATKELQQQGRLQVAGIIEEQHPDRCRLFMQWKQMGWPILVDSLNLLGVEVVPVTVAIDEYGIIRRINIPLKEAAAFARDFANRKYEPPAGYEPSPAALADLERLRPPAGDETADTWRAHGDAVFLWTDSRRISEAVAAYEKAVKLSPQDARSHFRLGVAYRKRYDSDERRPEDFQLAVGHWRRALELNPNQYIWRRRIQQYGPRLEKPYPFYDWVEAARKEIQARGETPVALSVEPSEAEFAKPLQDFDSAPNGRQEPDPKGLIHRDKGEFVLVETTVVPDTIAPGATTRFHVVFRPKARRKAHWNNEAHDLVLWLTAPEGWILNSRYFTFPNPSQTISREVRRLEFEAKSPKDAVTGRVRIPGYVLYYVCEDVTGTCLYRRQDLSLEVNVR